MKIENGVLVLVADGAKLLVFRNDGDSKYPVLTTLLHEEADNPSSREQGTDAPGRVRSSSGVRGSSYGETDWHEQAEADFARHAADVLDGLARAQRDAPIVVVAPPRTLGELRKRYGDQTGKRIIGEIAKDLAGHMTDDIVEVITLHDA